MASAEPGAPAIAVEVVYCPAPGAIDRSALTLPAGATLADAIAASGLAARHTGIGELAAGVWGRVRPRTTALRDGDRVEVYRALQVDPKEARRRRAPGPATRAARR